jgi:putative endonuclease
LVERQLCKLEVRGSNPLASSPESFRDCRAVASAKADAILPCNVGAATFDSASQRVSKFFYVYILQSEIDRERFYTGLTEDLPERLKAHNSGRVRHSAKWNPWRLKTYVASSDRDHAAKFKRYLKSASGRAFTKKHLWSLQ